MPGLPVFRAAQFFQQVHRLEPRRPPSQVFLGGNSRPQQTESLLGKFLMPAAAVQQFQETRHRPLRAFQPLQNRKKNFAEAAPVRFGLGQAGIKFCPFCQRHCRQRLLDTLLNGPNGFVQGRQISRPGSTRLGNQAVAATRTKPLGQVENLVFPTLAARAVVAGKVENQPQFFAEFLPPVLALDFAQTGLHERAVVNQLRAKFLAVVEGIFLQDALAETVNSADGCLVELVEGLTEDVRGCES